MEINNKQKYEIPLYDPYTGEINPYYESLTGRKHPFLVSKEENKIKKFFKKIFNRV
jgi:hypothetical protein